MLPTSRTPLEHGQRLGVHQPALTGLAQDPEQLLAILGHSREALRNPLQPATGRIQVFSHQELRYGFGKPRRRRTATSRRIHPRRIARILMIVADEMQRAVHHEMRPMGP